MRLVLVGGGHAHVEVLRSLAARPLPAAPRVTLVNPGPTLSYSGMLPGVVEGLYARADAEVDVAALARAVPGGEVVLGRAVGVDTGGRAVLVSSPTSAEVVRVPYDVVSLDVGAAPGWGGVPGADEWAVPVKPVAGLLDRVDAAMQGGGGGGPATPVAIVGGGPGGAEVAAALAVRLGRTGSVSLVCGGRLLPNLPAAARAAVRRRLEERLGVRVLEAERVTRVDGGGEGGAVTLTLATAADGVNTSLTTRAALWCTGAAAPAWLQNGPAPPPLDAAGFVAVGASLACSDDPASPLSRVFAVGDCASVLPHPRPKAGVFAVRQGPPLDAALRAAVGGAGQPPPFEPQAAATALLSTGRRTAVGVIPVFGRSLVVSGGWVWRLKDAIDRAWVARYKTAESGRE